MAKRSRGSTRPGQRRPLQRSTPKPATAAPTAAVAPRPATLTPQEEARAAELEAQIVAQERAADDARKRQTERRRGPASDGYAPSGELAVRAAEEYAYVGRDVRRIVLIGGGLILLLIGLWIVTLVTGSAAI